MEDILEKIFKKIEENDSIVIFGHVNPDGDCIGSIYGLMFTLKEHYPNKKIYKVGTTPNFLKDFEVKTEEVTLDIIKNSLAIMVDLCDLHRVEDQRIYQAKDIVCFDHHIKSHDDSFLVYRVEDAPSCTYVLTKVLLDKFKTLSKEASNYLYLGLLTDTDRFLTDSEEDTFIVASKLIHYGADYKDIYKKLYKQSLNDFKFKSFVYTNCKFDDKVTYCVFKEADYQAFNMNSNDCSNKVDLLSNVDSHPLWCFFVKMENGKIRVELRSDMTYDVQKVAIQFKGGGHLAASGCQLDSFDTIKDVLKALNNARKVN